MDPVLERTWVDGIGSGYRRGALAWGLGLSRTFGSPVFGSAERQDIWLGNVQLDLTLDDPWLKGTPFEGNLELVGLVSGGTQDNDAHAYLISVAPGLRYHFATGTRWIPFLSCSAGVALTDMKDPDLTGVFQFDLRFGGGLRWYATPRTALVLEYGMLHLSNGGADGTAHGVNTQMITLGLIHHF